MKRLLAAALFTAAVFLSFSSPAAAQNPRIYSLSNGATLAPASHGYDPSGAPIYIGGLVAGQAVSTTTGTFTLSVAFRSTGFVDEAGVHSGVIVSPYSSFAVTETSGRKSVTRSGTIDAGTVTYRLTPDGLVEIVSVSGNLTIWEGKNKRRTAVGSGTLFYGTNAAGSGTMELSYF